MAQPTPKPALTKAVRKEHPLTPQAAAPVEEPARKVRADETVQMNVRMPKSSRTAIKRAALDADATVNEWVLDAIEQKLEQQS